MKKNIISQQNIETILSGLRPRSPSSEVKGAIIEKLNAPESEDSVGVGANNLPILFRTSGLQKIIELSPIFLVIIFLCLFLISSQQPRSGFTIALSTNKIEIPESALSNQNLVTFYVGGQNNEHNILTTPLFKWTNLVISN
jgi:hypothetical protein